MRTEATEMQVKQYVAVVQGTYGKFMVFETGNPHFYLFAAIDKGGVQTGLQFPVRKADLRDDVRSALRYGYGNATI